MKGLRSGSYDDSTKYLRRPYERQAGEPEKVTTFEDNDASLISYVVASSRLCSGDAGEHLVEDWRHRRFAAERDPVATPRVTGAEVHRALATADRRARPRGIPRGL